MHPKVLCETKAKGTVTMNQYISVLYGEGFWIPAPRGEKLGHMLESYMLAYQACAYEAVLRGMSRFPMVPKAHMLAHTADEMIEQSKRGAWIINPLAAANQQQEDFIGRPCRLSRRVSVRSLHLRVIQRSLLACHQAATEDV